jgi:hypothetical protein
VPNNLNGSRRKKKSRGFAVFRFSERRSDLLSLFLDLGDQADTYKNFKLKKAKWLASSTCRLTNWWLGYWD